MTTEIVPSTPAPAHPARGGRHRRIALVHSFHHEAVPSGENVVVRAQADALRAAGHEVLVVAQHNDVRARRRTYPLEAAGTVATGVGPDPTAELAAFAPDVVHVHNLFPNFGTRWLGRWDGPLVATLHNFRPLCAAGTLLRDGARCTDCRTDRLAGVRHGCFRGSAVATLPLAVAGRRGPTEHPVLRRADRLVVISDRAREEYADAGVPRERFTVVPNAVADVVPDGHVLPPDPALADRWLFVGRLSAEKGLHELLDAWPADRGLDVVGSGELAEELRERRVPGVRLLGARSNAEVRAAVGSYAGLVVPSQWAEAGPPLTYVEALAAGVPTVACVGNGAADDVHDAGTGAVVSRRPDRAELTRALDAVAARRDAYRALCRAEYLRRFAPPAWIAALLDVYDEARRARPAPSTPTGEPR